MNDFLLVLGISVIAALLTFLGAPLAERFAAPQNLISAALQFAAGIITALVAFTLMPPAVRNGSPVGVAIGFFAGSALVGYLLFNNQLLGVKMVLVALTSDSLITTVIQSMIPEANREEEPSFTGILYIGGLSLYALSTLASK